MEEMIKNKVNYDGVNMSRYCWLIGKDCDAPIPCFYQCDKHNQIETKPIKAKIIINSIKELRKQMDNRE